MNEHPLTVREHLTELRTRLLISVVAWVVTTSISLVFYKQIIRFLLVPAEALRSPSPGEAGLIFTEVTEMLAATFKVGLMSGLVLAFPIILYQVIMFIAPGLTKRERRYLLAFMPAALLIFLGGAAFAYFVLIPPAINFLLKFGADIATPMIKIGNYISLMVRLLFWMGVVFETPLVMFILARLGVVSHRALARWRRYWVVVAFILGAIITPTFDPINQALVAGPLIVLYELGVWLARLGQMGRANAVPEVAESTGS